MWKDKLLNVQNLVTYNQEVGQWNHRLKICLIISSASSKSSFFSSVESILENNNLTKFYKVIKIIKVAHIIFLLQVAFGLQFFICVGDYSNNGKLIAVKINLFETI